MRKRRATLFLLFALLILSDFLLKRFVISHIPKVSEGGGLFPYGGIAIFQNYFGGVDFSINHVVNKGGAWGVFSSQFEYLVAFRVFVIAGLILYYFRKKKSFPLFLILTGAIGNIIDCFLYGHVIDMFLFNLWGYFFPLFNIADSLIFLGVFFLLIQILFQRKPHEKEQSEGGRSA